MAPYDEDTLWIKAKLFLNRAMDEGPGRSFDEQALWASLALELLAKAALSRTSPLLIAEPTEDGGNLLMASGLIEGDARFTSVRAATVFKRCHRAFKPFDQREATNISNARNEYLHGGGLGFVAIPEIVWWPRFWAQAVILIQALDSTVEELVGGSRAVTVGRHLEKNSQNVANRVQAAIERAKQRLSQFQSGVLSARVAAEWSAFDDSAFAMEYKSVQECPACKSLAYIEGEDAGDMQVDWEQAGDTFEPTVTVDVYSEYFSCETCHLVLDTPAFIQEAGLPISFEAEGRLENIYGEPDYGND